MAMDPRSFCFVSNGVKLQKEAERLSLVARWMCWSSVVVEIRDEMTAMFARTCELKEWRLLSYLDMAFARFGVISMLALLLWLLSSTEVMETTLLFEIERELILLALLRFDSSELPVAFLAGTISMGSGGSGRALAGGLARGAVFVHCMSAFISLPWFGS